MNEKFIWYPTKAAANLAKHGLSFNDVEKFDWDFVVDGQDISIEGEQRWTAIGPNGNRLCFLVYTGKGNSIRVISFREASAAERKRWRDEFQ